ncbi:MAG: galactosyltransferase Lgt5, partial [Rhodospirillales bacterium]|nr:galactosyltransferase Lgt5 [Rhodospirillales bacterium]
MDDPKFQCHALWIGERLPPLARACLGSFLRFGHRVVLYSYGPLADLPDGIELKDAASVVRPERIVRHARTKSPALFANHFRYKLLEREPGYWIDCDLYCIRPLSIAENPVFGWQDRQYINNALLRFDAGSPLLASLTALYE